MGFGGLECGGFRLAVVETFRGKTREEFPTQRRRCMARKKKINLPLRGVIKRRREKERGEGSETKGKQSAQVLCARRS